MIISKKTKKQLVIYGIYHYIEKAIKNSLNFYKVEQKGKNIIIKNY